MVMVVMLTITPNHFSNSLTSSSSILYFEILFSELLKSLLPCVLCKEIIFPAFAAARYEEPVIVEANMEAPEVVVPVAVLTRTASSSAPRSLQQVLVQVGGWARLDRLPARCRLVSRVAREVGVRIVDLGHEQAHPPENEYWERP